ncbi:MAG: hypothetical protein PHX24_03555 [Acidithiobacillus sp.]|nr:hypothetical protein [Acidithiobacillus sp.]
MKPHKDYIDAVKRGAWPTKIGGKWYAVDQADYSNRVFPRWWGDAKEDEYYLAEWCAQAITKNGEKYMIFWQFDEVKGHESSPDDYDWEKIDRIQTL